MVKLEPGFSTCREHGGRFAGDLAALDHLTSDHPELVDRLRAAVVVPMHDGDDPAAVAAAFSNRRARRTKKGRHRR